MVKIVLLRPTDAYIVLLRENAIRGHDVLRVPLEQAAGTKVRVRP
jgi:hypothetical protein